jgi:hypothetical protein
MASYTLDSLQTTPRRSTLLGRLAAWSRRHQREAMAQSLERALDEAGKARVFSSAVPVRAEAFSAREELLALAALLRTIPEPPARALALCQALILDGTSPLFNPEAAGTLRGAVNEALHAFDADPETYPDPV